jgi:hypothetical protein
MHIFLPENCRPIKLPLGLICLVALESKFNGVFQVELTKKFGGFRKLAKN